MQIIPKITSNMFNKYDLINVKLIVESVSMRNSEYILGWITAASSFFTEVSFKQQQCEQVSQNTAKDKKKIVFLEFIRCESAADEKCS